MRYLLIGLFYFFILFLQGCAYKSQMGNTLEAKSQKHQKLIQRFTQYWNYRSSCNPQKSFSYELPYQQYLLGKEGYIARMDRRYCGAKIFLKKIEHNKMYPDIAIIVRKVELKNGLQYPAKDKWIYIDGQWYHKFYQTVFPPEEKEADFQ